MRSLCLLRGECELQLAEKHPLFPPSSALSESLVYLSDVGSLWDLEVGCRENDERMGVRFPPGQGWVGVCRATAKRGRPTRAA